MTEHVIALDLGGTQTRAALVSRDGTLSHRVALPTPAREGADAVVAQLARAAREAAQGAPRITGVGLCSPGPIDTTTGVTLLLPTIRGMEDFPLREKLAEALGLPVVVENDGIAAAIGEWRHGSGRGVQSLVYVTVSTGIGGGVILDGRVLRGRKGMAGHVGHLTVEAHGLRCGCGNAGCWEAYAAGPAFAARARAALKQDALEPQQVFALAADGNATAQALVSEEARWLGVGLTSLLHLYSPERVVIGGGLSNAFDQLYPGIEAYIQSNAMPPFRDVPILPARLGGNSGLTGAAALVFGDA